MKHHALLAIDTSTEMCSVAVCFPISTDPVSERTPVDPVQMHDDPESGLRFLVFEALTGSVSSTVLLPAVDAVLNAAGIAVNDCVALAFGAGPGSFTGLRTATGAAQGLAFGAGLQVIPVNTLMACAENARMRGNVAACRHVMVASDARMAECYWQAFEWTGPERGWSSVTQARVGAPDTVETPWSGDAAASYLLAGNAALVFGDAFVVRQGAHAVDTQARPGAAAIASLAWRAWQAGETMAPAQALPHYVRDKVASTTREREIEKARRAAQVQ